MKKISVLSIVALMIALCIGLSACTIKLSDPSVTDEKAKLEYVQVQAENGTWHDLSGKQAEQLFEIVKSKGELSGEALDVAISGNSTINTTYDYTFKMAFTTGNFFLKKRGEFVYNVGERFKRTYSDGRVNERITEEKLVVMKTLSKGTALLSEDQLQAVKDIFEPINSQVINLAFERIPEGFKDSAYTVEVIPTQDLSAEFFTACGGTPLNADKNLIKFYKITGPSDTCYAFLTASVEWAMETDGWKYVRRVGRVCYSTGSCATKIGDILRS